MFIILNRTEKIHLFLPPDTHSMFSLVHCTLKTQMRRDSSVHLYLHHIKEGVFNNKHETYALNKYVKKQNMIYCLPNDIWSTLCEHNQTQSILTDLCQHNRTQSILTDLCQHNQIQSILTNLCQHHQIQSICD